MTFDFDRTNCDIGGEASQRKVPRMFSSSCLVTACKWPLDSEFHKAIQPRIKRADLWQRRLALFYLSLDAVARFSDNKYIHVNWYYLCQYN